MSQFDFNNAYPPVGQDTPARQRMVPRIATENEAAYPYVGPDTPARSTVAQRTAIPPSPAHPYMPRTTTENHAVALYRGDPVTSPDPSFRSHQMQEYASMGNSSALAGVPGINDLFNGMDSNTARTVTIPAMDLPLDFSGLHLNQYGQEAPDPCAEAKMADHNLAKKCKRSLTDLRTSANLYLHHKDQMERAYEDAREAAAPFLTQARKHQEATERCQADFEVLQRRFDNDKKQFDLNAFASGRIWATNPADISINWSTMQTAGELQTIVCIRTNIDIKEWTKNQCMHVLQVIGSEQRHVNGTSYAHSVAFKKLEESARNKWDEDWKKYCTTSKGEHITKIILDNSRSRVHLQNYISKIAALEDNHTFV